MLRWIRNAIRWIRSLVKRKPPLDNEEGVLFEVPSGKQYISEEVLKPQSKQKGPSCWYYAFNYLRPRLGNSFTDQIPERKIERIFSTYRKSITESSRQFKNHRNESQRASECIMAAKKALRALECKPKVELTNYLKKNGYRPLTSTTDLAAAYNTVVINKAYEFYKLKKSEWHPGKSIDDLISLLQRDGICCVFGFNGVPYYKGPEQKLNDDFAKRTVYGWLDHQYQKDSMAHAIVIVGAKKIGGEGYVYFIEPNKPNNPESPAKVYRIPYTLLVRNAFPINCPKNEPSPRDTFAVHANRKHMGYVRKNYGLFNNRNILSTKEAIYLNPSPRQPSD